MNGGSAPRVLQAMAGAAHGGAELFFERLTLALRRAGVQQHILIRNNAERAAKLTDGGLRPVQAPFGGRFDVITRWRFAREIRRFQPTLVLTWMTRATRFCPTAKAIGAPFIHVARLGGYYDLKHYRRCDHLVCNTEDLVEYVVKEGWPVERAHYLPNFADERAAPPADRARFYTPKAVPLLFALGRLHENKGFDVLVKALARLPDVYLWIAGEGPQRRALETLAYDLGVKPRIRFLGWRDDAPALHGAADVFVCPSRHEPLGNVVIEAWAQGKPVVATASEGPSGLIDHGVNGLLSPVDDALALSETLREAMRDREGLKRMAAAGRKTFTRRFTQEKAVARYRAFLERVAGECAA